MVDPLFWLLQPMNRFVLSYDDDVHKRGIGLRLFWPIAKQLTSRDVVVETMTFNQRVVGSTPALAAT